ncbi:hypothetical protein TcG_06383 [Trypanosoma cruzi]|uniref:Uncharacterized protein n=2 Tax=Trypanosoma cruzi TaxID=5693 RepID=V5D870_TRYCR|nr:hypothetical protein TCDM_08463 [Trypanosoma cruzi Dm28c]KAF8286350.1 putative Mitochondrial SSU ribosomal protein [Trypanosoma cruzi]PBJ80675.1 hypothetical protein BCY84_00870 [Trypanosoma cruzi cruzi]PWU91649.1 hypothetical protein C4B63_42g175 [Trypanosoma cruzi]RNF16237.1 hypothetical protein TcG_06383 [Trypanosoma cruzi]
MLRRTSWRAVGYTPVNPDTSPMLAYSQYHWHYNLPQGMERPHGVNRTMTAPYQSAHSLVNKYRGVWIELEMHPAFRVALEPQLRKLPQGRTIPKTSVDEVISDYINTAHLIQDEMTRDLWLAKVLQHCAFQRSNEGMALWEKYCHSRFIADGATATPPLPLVKAILFYCSKIDHQGWCSIFQKCLKNDWNYTPLFDTAQWNFLLKSVGRMGDEKGVRLILEEMLDVQADLDRVEARSIVIALNAVTDNDIYEYIKKYLFNFGERKVKFLRIIYSDLRGHGAGKLRIPLKENDKMFYHVCWHSSIRAPRQFSPRQLYFDYKPSTLGASVHNPNAKIDDIVKDKIEKWKTEGLLPEDYVHEDRVYDRGTAFKNVARQEKWKKMPRIVKSKKMGYTGDP